MTPYGLENRIVERQRRAERLEPLFDDDDRADELQLIPRRTEPRDRFFTHRSGKLEHET